VTFAIVISLPDQAPAHVKYSIYLLPLQTSKKKKKGNGPVSFFQ